jgi:hypothetical protein
VTISVAEGQGPYTYSISWGDGERQSVAIGDKTAILEHRYGRLGNYTATVTVSDSNGETSDVNFSVQVRQSAGNIPFIPIALVAALSLLLYFLIRKKRRKRSAEQHNRTTRGNRRSKM